MINHYQEHYKLEQAIVYRRDTATLASEVSHPDFDVIVIDKFNPDNPQVGHDVVLHVMHLLQGNLQDEMDLPVGYVPQTQAGLRHLDNGQTELIVFDRTIDTQDAHKALNDGIRLVSGRNREIVRLDEIGHISVNGHKLNWTPND